MHRKAPPGETHREEGKRAETTGMLIGKMWRGGMTPTDIAKELGIHRSSVYKHLGRNPDYIASRNAAKR